MIVSWIELGYRPLPWQNEFVKVAVVAAAPQPGNYRIRRLNDAVTATRDGESISHFLDDLEQAAGDLASENGGILDLDRLLQSFPDRGTTIKASSRFRGEMASIDDALAGG